MKLTRRSALAGATAAALPLPAIGQSVTKVAVGYVSASDFVPLLVAKDKGFFQKRGIDADPKRIPIMTNIPAGLVSGDLQIGACTMPVLLQANDGGLELQLVSGAARHLKETSKIGLIVRAGLDRKSTRLNSSHIPLSRMPSSA